MAIVNSVKTLFPGFGNVTEYIAAPATNLPINAATATALTGFTNFVRSFKLRLHIITAPAASQITAIKITGTDGTTTTTFYQDATARTAAETLDMFWDILSDLNLTTVTITVTLANAGSAMTADIEIAGNP